MRDKIWKWVAIAVIAGNVIYFLIIDPMWTWKAMVEKRLDVISQGVVRKHPDLGQPQGQKPEGEGEQ